MHDNMYNILSLFDYMILVYKSVHACTQCQAISYSFFDACMHGVCMCACVHARALHVGHVQIYYDSVP